ncbi:hypothetical protein [Streptomyces syringium]|uniref:hypothetical protein n=1 Tax=Streptomyces syringium TaxID=76729 RepID=UPI00340804D0
MADEGRSIAVTIKYGPECGASGVSFQGPPEGVFGDVASFFGLDSDTCASMTLGELVLEAAQLAQGSSHIACGLGAHVVPQEPNTTPDRAREAARETRAGQPLLDEIEACGSVEELKKWWAENQAAFADQAVMDAWKARGRLLAS